MEGGGAGGRWRGGGERVREEEVEKWRMRRRRTTPAGDCSNFGPQGNTSMTDICYPTLWD
eukprot:1446728-Pyramimonas_sp.AAC.1